MGPRHPLASRVLVLVSFAVLEAACVQREPVTGIYDCALLIVGEGAGRVTYGGIASLNHFRAGTP